jgi:hypothetical protein
MPKGAVYYHSKFPFSDGTQGTKRFVVLNEPTGDEPYLVVKTTTNLRNRTYRNGCNPDRKVFYLPAKTENSFELATLIQFAEIFPFSKADFLKGHLEEQVITPHGNLTSLTIAQILNCLKKIKEDIDQQFYQMIFK